MDYESKSKFIQKTRIESGLTQKELGYIIIGGHYE